MKLGAWLAAAATLTIAATTAGAQEIKISQSVAPEHRRPRPGDPAVRARGQRPRPEPEVPHLSQPLADQQPDRADRRVAGRHAGDGGLPAGLRDREGAGVLDHHHARHGRRRRPGDEGQEHTLYDKLQEVCAQDGIRVITWWWTPGRLRHQGPRDQGAQFGEGPAHARSRPLLRTDAEGPRRLGAVDALDRDLPGAAVGRARRAADLGRELRQHEDLRADPARDRRRRPYAVACCCSRSSCPSSTGTS